MSTARLKPSKNTLTFTVNLRGVVLDTNTYDTSVEREQNHNVQTRLKIDRDLLFNC